MKVIDLSVPLTHKMPVYPGDPEVDITEIHSLEKEGWRLRRMTLTTHLGTHANVPYHMAKTGKKLDQYSLGSFFGPAVIFTEQTNWDKETGVILSEQNIDRKITDLLCAQPPKFVGLSAQFKFDIALEKLLLEHDIISFENLENTELLPEKFMFYGVPLKINGADGSPVRAFAIVEETEK